MESIKEADIELRDLALASVRPHEQTYKVSGVWHDGGDFCTYQTAENRLQAALLMKPFTIALYSVERVLGEPCSAYRIRKSMHDMSWLPDEDSGDLQLQSSALVCAGALSMATSEVNS